MFFLMAVGVLCPLPNKQRELRISEQVQEDFRLCTCFVVYYY